MLSIKCLELLQHHCEILLQGQKSKHGVLVSCSGCKRILSLAILILFSVPVGILGLSAKLCQKYCCHYSQKNLPDYAKKTEATIQLILKRSSTQHDCIIDSEDPELLIPPSQEKKLEVDELQIKVFSFLNLQDKASAMQVNKQWHKNALKAEQRRRKNEVIPCINLIVAQLDTEEYSKIITSLYASMEISISTMEGNPQMDLMLSQLALLPADLLQKLRSHWNKINNEACESIIGLSQVYQAIALNKKPYNRSLVLYVIKNLVKINWEKAIQVASEIEGEKQQIFNGIVSLLTKYRIDRAVALLSNEFCQLEAQKTVVEALLGRGQYEKAFQIIEEVKFREIYDTYTELDLLSQVLVKAIKNDKIDIALVAISKLKKYSDSGSDSRVDSLLNKGLEKIIIYYIEQGDFEKAFQATKTMTNAAAVLPILKYILCYDKYIHLAPSILDLINAEKYGEDRGKVFDEGLAHIAIHYIEKKEFDKVSPIEKITDTAALYRVLSSALRSDQISLALTITDLIKDPTYHNIALKDIACYYAEKGELEAASRIVKAITDSWDKEIALHKIEEEEAKISRARIALLL